MEKSALLAEVQLKEARLNEQNAQITAMQKIIQPHFLLNSLNYIIASLRTRSRTSEETQKKISNAENMIVSLSEEFRFVLEKTKLKKISIDSEIEICKTHLKIMAMRRSKNYTLKTKGIDGKEEIPPLVFHTIVENALTHEHSESQGIDILIEKAKLKSAKGIVYKVICSGRIKAKRNYEEGTGTNYIKTRLRDLYGRRFSYNQKAVKNGWEVSITISNNTDIPHIATENHNYQLKKVKTT